MNNEDVSDIIQKFSTMLNNSNDNNFENNNTEDTSFESKETNFNFEDILNNFKSNNNQNENSNENQNGGFNFDFETIMKMKNIMDKMNSTKNSPESNLLLSLKPYLNNGRKQKLDQYMQFLNISKVLKSINSENSAGNKNG